jgi:hypothetical protein
VAKRMMLVLSIGALLVVLASGAVLAKTINGTAKKDSIEGTPNADRISGRAGDDTLWGGRGYDRVVGGDGNDVLAANEMVGGPGEDGLGFDLGGTVAAYGGDGNDRIGIDDDHFESGTPPDTAECGPGTDRVWANPDDTVADNCEIVEIVEQGIEERENAHQAAITQPDDAPARKDCEGGRGAPGCQAVLMERTRP